MFQKIIKGSFKFCFIIQLECFINIRVWLKIDFCFKDKGFEEVFYNKIKEVKEFEKYKIGFKIMIYGIVSNLIFG